MYPIYTVLQVLRTDSFNKHTRGLRRVVLVGRRLGAVLIAWQSNRFLWAGDSYRLAVGFSGTMILHVTDLVTQTPRIQPWKDRFGHPKIPANPRPILLSR